MARKVPLGAFLDYFETILRSGNPEVLHIPHLIIGGVGIGKTRGIEYVAKKAGYEVVLFPLSRHRPDHLEGLLIPPEEGEVAERLLPPLFEAVRKNDGKVVVFLDELNTANKYMLNAALSFIQNRELAGTPLPEKAVIVAAGNPAGSDIANVSELKPVITSRFNVFYVTADFNYVLREGIAEKLYAPEVVAYLSMYPEAYDDPEPYELRDNTAPVYAVPRTWEALSHDIRSGIIEVSNEYLEFIEAHVGPVHAQRLLDFGVTQETIDYVLEHNAFKDSWSPAYKLSVLVRVSMIYKEEYNRIRDYRKKADLVFKLFNLVKQLPKEFQRGGALLVINYGARVSDILVKLIVQSKGESLKKLGDELLDFVRGVIGASKRVELFNFDSEGEA